MAQINNIPSWMEQFIPEITSGEIKTLSELKEFESDGMSSGIIGVLRTGVISTMNAKIDLLNELKNSGKLILAEPPAKSTKIDWNKVQALLSDKIGEGHKRWVEVLDTNICIGWYNTMIN